MTSTTQLALITGGSRGLGRNTAIHLARAGVDSVVTYRAERADADAVVAEIEALGRKAVALQLDTGAHASFPAFAEQLARTLQETWSRDSFDVLVNNAGGALHAPIAETTEEQFDGVFDVHVKGVFFLTQRLLPLLADGGTIVNVSSGLARFSFPGSGAYAAAKGAVEVLTRYLALELGGRGITVNTIAPGAIATDFSGGMVRDNPEMQAGIAAQTALGRVGQPDDVGGAIAALVTSTSRWITGERIEVSGGMRL
ncbi:SDR family oxidoreductase [Conexibacter sp. JD483]|uniref:SDR family NAD(P)-dependent oxidoreductase n=1 Tax=unclassified Conexibacter TaxID=2627773 RepID=UPI00271A03D3|nr:MULTISPECIES: SDR family oxidoreductase [unclassified Conexibacter]MDO8187256.1 SDR family oxidoreductase [Conexibacter sp. CPCC 205706]MDO8198865.1 SDR family oxidoreductase [Conexibacter sp. CPCC 205762]MDR9372627.1 SDR family oxidoreductase [Conexibacter sp. JD483]